MDRPQADPPSPEARRLGRYLTPERPAVFTAGRVSWAEQLGSFSQTRLVRSCVSGKGAKGQTLVHGG